MIRLLINIVLNLVGNALGLLVASWVLDDVTVTASGFIVAVIIFTVVEVLFQPLLTQVALSSVPALRGSVALVATLIGLIVTSLVSDGLDIKGFSTWVLATLIVWAISLIAALILPLIFLRNRVEEKKK